MYTCVHLRVFLSRVSSLFFLLFHFERPIYFKCKNETTMDIIDGKIDRQTDRQTDRQADR